jgi:hypothetical protein
MTTMKRHRHTPEQIVRKLRAGEQMLNEGRDLTEVLRHLEVTESTWNRPQQTDLIYRSVLGQLLQHRLVQLRLGQQALAAGVLPLELPEPLGPVGLHAAVLVPPPNLAETLAVIAYLGAAAALATLAL